MADYFEKSRHDLSVTDTVSGDVLGYVLARGDKGQLLYSEYDGKYLADQFFTDAATQSNLDPEKELLLGQSDWRSGFGLSIYDPNDPKRYESSYGADLRFKDRAALSYGSTAIPIAALQVSPTSTTDGAAAWTDDANSIDDDWTTYATDASVAINTWSEYLEFNIASTTILGVAVNACGASNNVNKIDIDVYYNAQWNSLASSETFTFNNVDPTGGVNKCKAWYISQAGVTAFRVRLYNDDDAVTRNVYITEAYFLKAGTTTTTSAEANFNDRHYVAINRVLSKIHTGGTYADPVAVFPANISSLETMTISGTDYLFIGNGLSNAYWYSTTTEVIVKSTAADPNKQFFKVVYTTATTMYGNDSNSTIRSTTNPLNGGVAWSDVTQVDNDADDITSLFSQSGALYIGKEDKPYYLSAAGAVQNDLAPECTALASSTSGRVVTIWQGNIYYVLGDQALLEIGTTNTWRSPALYCTKQSDFNGKITGIAFDDQFLFLMLNNTTKVEILAGREETIDGTTSWVWHPYQEITVANGHRLFASTYYQKRLYVISAVGTMYDIPLPTGYGDITSDANRSFLTGGYFTTPFLHGNFKETTKGLISVTSSLGHAYDADIYWTISYKKLGDTSWTSLGNAVGTATDRTHTLFRTTSTTSPMFQFKFAGVTDTTNTSPELLSYTAKLIMYPTIRKLIFCTVRVGDGVTDKAGLTMSNKTVLQKTCLNNARNASWLVSFTDIDGTSAKAKFLPLPSGTPRRVPVKDEKGRTIEWEYNLLLMEVATS